MKAYECILEDGPATRMTLQRSVSTSFGRQAGRQLGHRFAGRGPLQAKQSLERAGGIRPSNFSQPPSRSGRMLYVDATGKKAARESGNAKNNTPAHGCREQNFPVQLLRVCRRCGCAHPSETGPEEHGLAYDRNRIGVNIW
eukprot:scaffold43363_cov95-Phaeocystis_antarctica.AAC.2